MYEEITSLQRGTVSSLTRFKNSCEEKAADWCDHDLEISRDFDDLAESIEELICKVRAA